MTTQIAAVISASGAYSFNSYFFKGVLYILTCGPFQSLPWPGKRGLREDAARARAEGREQSLADGRLALMAAAKRLFAEWAYIHRTLKIKHAHRDLLTELRRVAETQYTVGRGRQQDVLQAEVEAARIEADIVTHQRRRSEVQAMINGLLNRPPQSPLPPPASLPDDSLRTLFDRNEAGDSSSSGGEEEREGGEEREGRLRAQPMGRGIAWLDTGTPENLLQASSFVHALESRQGLIIGCPEEAAYRSGFIDRAGLRRAVESLPQCPYRAYIAQLLNDNA